MLQMVVSLPYIISQKHKTIQSYRLHRYIWISGCPFLPSTAVLHSINMITINNQFIFHGWNICTCILREYRKRGEYIRMRNPRRNLILAPLSHIPLIECTCRAPLSHYQRVGNVRTFIIPVSQFIEKVRFCASKEILFSSGRWYLISKGFLGKSSATTSLINIIVVRRFGTKPPSRFLL